MRFQSTEIHIKRKDKSDRSMVGSDRAREGAGSA